MRRVDRPAGRNATLPALFATVDPERQRQWEQRRDALVGQAEAAQSEDGVAPTLMFELMQLMAEHESIPRRLVFHPSTNNRELAWSMARIDFWFNDVDGLADEVKSSGGETMPAAFDAIDIGQAQTWPFHERPGTVSVEAHAGGTARLVVRSSGTKPAVAAQSHYAVAMFALDEDEKEGKPLAEPDAEVQAMLDWLALNHHDFMRLNDFAEALALSRWAKSDAASFDAAELGTAVEPVPSPDRIVIGEGPQLPPTNRQSNRASTAPK